MAEKKRFRLASFWERASGTAFRRVPSQKYPWLKLLHFVFPRILLYFYAFNIRLFYTTKTVNMNAHKYVGSVWSNNYVDVSTCFNRKHNRNGKKMFKSVVILSQTYFTVEIYPSWISALYLDFMTFNTQYFIAHITRRCRVEILLLSSSQKVLDILHLCNRRLTLSSLNFNRPRWRAACCVIEAVTNDFVK
jgi:hypothetical protein